MLPRERDADAGGEWRGGGATASTRQGGERAVVHVRVGDRSRVTDVPPTVRGGRGGDKWEGSAGAALVLAELVGHGGAAWYRL